MNDELLSQVESLAESLHQVKPGNIATLADVLAYLGNIGAMGQAEGFSAVQPATSALSENIKLMIMGDTDDEPRLIEVLATSVKVMQEAFAEGRGPEISDFPADLHLAESSDGSSRGAEGAFAADKELLAEYLSEQRSRLEEIEGYLLVLENSSDDAAMGGLKRALHTIKGDSGFLGLSRVAQLAHAAESYLEEASYPFDLECLFAVKDWLTSAFEDLTTTDGITQRTVAELVRVMDLLERHQHENEAQAAGEVFEEPEAAPEPEPEPEHIVEAAPEPEPEPEPAPEPIVEAAPEPEPEPEESGAQDAPESFFDITAEESLLVDFISESKEHLEQASTQLLGLEDNPDDEEAINSVFRAFHTIKGVAGFLALKDISDLAHNTENLLDMVRRHELKLSAGLIDISFEALDWMTRLINNVAKGLAENGKVKIEPELKDVIKRVQDAQRGVISKPQPKMQRATQGPTDTPASLGQILVDSGAISDKELEQTIQEVESEGTGRLLGEALVEKKKVSASEVHEALKIQQEEKRGRKAVELKETIRVDYERLESLVDTVGELVLAEAMISQDESLMEIQNEQLTKKLYNLRQVSRKLQEMGTTIRMVPIAGTFQKMARLVRDLSRKSGKPINFTTSGDETELDRAYVDQIADPLVHMIRNSMDHGIEPREDRIKAGKNETGTLRLRAFHEGGNIHVEISDDGKGLDKDRILAKAIERNIIAEDAELSEQEIYQLIFEPGFSTAQKVTEVSGRGVGMDVVRRNISELRGQVGVSSAPGKGTTIRLTLPLTMALIDGMLVKVGDERFIIPVLSVVESTRPAPEMVNTVVGRGEMISLRERQLPLYRMYKLFNIANAKEKIHDGLVVVVEHESRLFGLLVDELIGMQQTVIKGLGGGVFNTQGFSGSTIMGDGRVGLILDVAGLLDLARKGVTTEFIPE